MKNLSFNSVSFLAVFLLYFCCKNEEQLPSYNKPNISVETPEGVSLEGKWSVDSLTLSSVTVPSFCYQIGEGSIFEFTENDSLKVYPKDDVEPCEIFSYTAQDDLIQVTKDDMIMLVEYELVTEGRLLLKSKSFFRWEKDAVTDSLIHQTLLKEGVTAFLSKK